MQRLINATMNSARGFRFLWRDEAAFKLEAVLLVLALPVAWLIAPDLHRLALLIVVLLALLLVEALNTGIEAACDAYSREFNTDIQHAKDCGSLAVSLTIIIAATVWGLALWDWLFAAI